MDGLERKLEGRAQVLRLAVTDDVGGALAMRYNVRVGPTFVLLNGAGRVVLEQAGAPDQAAVIAAVEQLD